MQLNLNKQRGFTLIEILIVIAILGVLAGLAAPIYTVQVEKSRKVEALDHLSQIRAAEVRYYSDKASFTTDWTKLDYTPKNTSSPATIVAATDAAGQKHHFYYTIAAVSSTFTVTATRNATVDSGDTANTVTLTQDGTVSGSGIWS